MPATDTRNRERKDYIQAFAGFPRISDWLRPENDRMTTTAVQVSERITVFYSYDMPIGFTKQPDPEDRYVTLSNDQMLILLQLPVGHPCRTKTTMTHITRLRNLHERKLATIQLPMEQFIHEYHQAVMTDR